MSCRKSPAKVQNVGHDCVIAGHRNDYEVLSVLSSALPEQSLCTLGTSCEEYLTGFQLPSDSERTHASMAASLFFSASSTYLQDLIMLSHTERTNNPQLTLLWATAMFPALAGHLNLIDKGTGMYLQLTHHR